MAKLVLSMLGLACLAPAVLQQGRFAGLPHACTPLAPCGLQPPVAAPVMLRQPLGAPVRDWIDHAHSCKHSTTHNSKQM